jgi:hypothetical protein
MSLKEMKRIELPDHECSIVLYDWTSKAMEPYRNLVCLGIDGQVPLDCGGPLYERCLYFGRLGW